MPAGKTLNRVLAFSIPLLLLLTLVCWAYSSTVGSSPDDNFHLPSIWCGLGLREGLCQASGDSATRLVPASIADRPCFAFDSSISGACWNAAATGLGEAKWLNTGSLYPALYYAVMGVMASPDVQTSVLAMRLFNAVLAVGLLTATYFALPRFLRPAILISTLASVVPLGLFLVTSTNPSSWALVSAAMTWVCLYGALRTTGRRQIALCVLTLVGVVIGAGSRVDAAAFAVLGIIVACLLGARRTRAAIVPAITAAVGIAVALVFYFTTAGTRSPVAALGLDQPPLSMAEQVSNLLGIPGLWMGVFGSVPLGWLDTSMPAIVFVLAFGAFCASVIVGLRSVSPRRAIALGLVTLALWVVPFVFLSQSNTQVASNLIQPRYIMPLLVILLSVSAATPGARHRWSLARIVVVGGALSIAATLALHVNLRRYTTGADQPAIDPGANAEWWWTGAPAPVVIWLVGSIAFTLVFALLAIAQVRAPKGTVGPDPERALEAT
jgi:hypothetical protein